MHVHYEYLHNALYINVSNAKSEIYEHVLLFVPQKVHKQERFETVIAQFLALEFCICSQLTQGLVAVG